MADALGAPLENKTREEIAPIQGLTERFRPYGDYPLGQYTDDTQMTLAIATSMVQMGSVEGAGIAAQMVRLFESGEIVGAGPVAKRAVRRLMEGIAWQEAADREDLPLNGAAMRVAPIGLWHCDRPQALVNDAETSSYVTHRHPLAVAAAIAAATAVSTAVSMERIDTAGFLQTVSDCVRNRGDGTELFADHIVAIGQWLELDATQAMQAIVDASGQKPGRRGFVIQALAEPTVLAALYAFLKTPTDYVATVTTSLRAGGDVDTIAAIAGAISGAHNAVEAIPGHLVRDVLDSSAIRQLAVGLYDKRP